MDTLVGRIEQVTLQLLAASVSVISDDTRALLGWFEGGCWTLPEAAFLELRAEDDTLVVGNASLDTLVVGNASLTTLV